MEKTKRCFHTQLCRTILLVFVCAAWRNQSYLNVALQDLWAVLRENSLFRHDSFEPLVVSISFFFSMGFYYALDMWIPSAKKWRIQKRHTDMKAWKVEHGNRSTRTFCHREFNSQCQIWLTSQCCFRFKNEIVWYWVPIALFDFLYPRRSLPLTAPSFWQLLLEIVASLLVYDAFFFCFHLAFHKVAILVSDVTAMHAINGGRFHYCITDFMPNTIRKKSFVHVRPCA